MRFDYFDDTKAALARVLGNTIEFEDQITQACKGDDVSEVAVHPIAPGLSGAAVFLIRRIGGGAGFTPWVVKACNVPELIIAERENNLKWVQGKLPAAPRLIRTGSSRVLLFEFGGALASYDPRTLRSGYASSSTAALATLMHRIVTSLKSIDHLSEDTTSCLNRMPLVRMLDKFQDSTRPLPPNVVGRLRDSWRRIWEVKDQFPRIRSTAHGDLNSGNVIFEPGIAASLPVFIDFASMRRSKDNIDYEDGYHLPFWDYAKLERDIQTRLFLNEAIHSELTTSTIIEGIRAVNGLTAGAPRTAYEPVAKLITTSLALREAIQNESTRTQFIAYRAVLAYAMLTVLFREQPDEDVQQLQYLVAAESSIALLADPFAPLPTGERSSTNASRFTVSTADGNDTASPQRGVAALAIRSGDRLPSLFQVSVRFAPGPNYVGLTGDGDAPRRRLASDAAIWVGQYIRRFSGRLRKVVERNASFPVFNVPEGHYDSPDQIRAAMSIAYLARILHDALCYDLALPVYFPESLMVCAAGMGERGGAVIGLEGWLDAIHRERWPDPATIWHVPDRSGNRPGMPPLPPTVKLIAVDHMDQIARSLLEELESFLPHSAAPETIANSLRQSIGKLYTLEKLLEDATHEALGRQAYVDRLEEEIGIRERQSKWLDETALQVRECLRKRRPMPQPSDLLDQFTLLEHEPNERPMAEKNRDVLVIRSGFEEQSERCLLLFRRLARNYHPDVQPAEPEMFLQLVAHRWDLMWLEALDGATEPLRIEASAVDIEKRIDGLIDRLYLLKDVGERFDRKIAAKEQQLESVGGRAAQALEEDVKSRQIVLSIVKQDIDRGWRALNYMAAWHPAGK